MKILVVQQKMIGDVLTSSILFEVLRAKYPEAELHYLINTHTFAVVENNPFIDKFIFFTKELESSKIKLYSFLKEIQTTKYDIVIDTYGKTSSNLITCFSKAKTKISIKKTYTSFLYTHTYRDSTIAITNAGLAIENRMQLLKPIINEPLAPVQPKIYLTEAEIERTKSFLTQKSIDLKQPLIMIGVLGSDTFKTYPFEYMAAILDHVIETIPNAQLLFNYIPTQIEDAKTIFNFCKAKTQQAILLDIYGKSLRDFICITHFCDALIGNEGGAVNMAKALKTPTFTIFSPWIKKEAWSLFENGSTNISIHLKDVKPELFKDVSGSKLKKLSLSFYKAFKPEFIKEKLSGFLKYI